MDVKLILVVVAMVTALCVAEVPDDANASWPSPMDFQELWKQLSGDLYFPRTAAYTQGGEMHNNRFDSSFGVVVMVETAEDVQAVMIFCGKHGIRPTVKSSGHDYIGRSGGNRTLSINLARMRRFAVQDDARAHSGVSATVESGNGWGEIYEKIGEAGYIIVGGNSLTVSPGGYTLGGGHSPISRMYGLAVDNLIGFTLVTAEGHIINMTKTVGSIQRAGSSVSEPYVDVDLFWAVRGGGGGTFGVVTTFTFQVFRPPEDGFCRYIGIYPMVVGGKRLSPQILQVFSRYLRYNLTDNWGGYLAISPEMTSTNHSDPDSTKVSGILTFSLLHAGGCETAKPQVKHLMSIFPQHAFYQQVRNYTTFWEYVKDSSEPVMFRTYVINRFIQPNDLDAPQLLSNVLTDVISNRMHTTCTWTLLGGKVSRFDEASSAVSPAFRSALGSVTCRLGWLLPADDDFNIRVLQDYSRKLYTIGDGVYFNEPDQYLPDWQTQYWGPASNYQRLLKVKRQYDGHQRLWCHHCVGSDLERPGLMAANVQCGAETRAAAAGKAMVALTAALTSVVNMLSLFK